MRGRDMTNTEKLREQIEGLLYRYWESLSEPKQTYTQWYYGKGRYFDLLNEGTNINPVFTDIVNAHLNQPGGAES